MNSFLSKMRSLSCKPSAATVTTVAATVATVAVTVATVVATVATVAETVSVDTMFNFFGKVWFIDGLGFYIGLGMWFRLGWVEVGL